MRDATSNNGRKRRTKQELEEALEQSMPSFSPEDRNTVLKGMRILARVAIRAYMEKQTDGSGAAANDDRDEGG